MEEAGTVARKAREARERLSHAELLAYIERARNPPGTWRRGKLNAFANPPTIFRDESRFRVRMTLQGKETKLGWFLRPSEIEQNSRVHI